MDRVVIGIEVTKLLHAAAIRRGFGRNYIMLKRKSLPARACYRVIGVSDLSDLDTVGYML